MNCAGLALIAAYPIDKIAIWPYDIPFLAASVYLITLGTVLLIPGDSS